MAEWGVVIESKDGGVILPEGYLALRLDGDKIVTLSHPLETKILQEHGYTWVSALKEKRLIRVRYRVCKTCGTIHEEEIGAGRSGISGCFFASVGGFLVALVLHFGPGWSWDRAGTWGYVSVFAISDSSGFWIGSWLSVVGGRSIPKLASGIVSDAKGRRS